MIIVVAIIVGVNVLQNASKCTISKEYMPKFFWEGAQPLPQTPPHWEGIPPPRRSLRLYSTAQTTFHALLTSNPEYAPG